MSRASSSRSGSRPSSASSEVDLAMWEIPLFPLSRSAVLPQSPGDEVTQLRWRRGGGFPQLLAASSWDSTCSIWKVVHGPEGAITPTKITEATHGSGVLCLDFADAQWVLTGEANGTVARTDFSTGGYEEIGKHAGPVLGLSVMTQSLTASAAMDRTLGFWDYRAAAPVGKYKQERPVEAMDGQWPFMVVAMWGGQAAVHDIRRFDANCPLRICRFPRANEVIRRVRLSDDAASMAMSSRGCWIYRTTLEDHVVVDEVLNIETPPNHALMNWRVHHNATNGLPVFDFHPNSNHLIIAAQDTSLGVYDEGLYRVGAGWEAGVPVKEIAFDRQQGALVALAVGYNWRQERRDEPRGLQNIYIIETEMLLADPQPPPEIDPEFLKTVKVGIG